MTPKYEVIQAFEVKISGKFKGAQHFEVGVFVMARTQQAAQEIALDYARKEFPGLNARHLKLSWAVEPFLYEDFKAEASTCQA